MSSLGLKTQPHSVESEQVVLASCLLEPEDTYDLVSQIVSADDFYVNRHRLVFAAIGQLVNDAVEVSEITLLEKLRSNGDVEEVGGTSAIYAIMDVAETATHAKFAASIVREASKKRSIISSSRVAIESCFDGDRESDDIMASVEKGFQNIAENGSSDFSLEESLRIAGEELTTTSIVESTPMGIPSYDETMTSGGEVAGQVHIIAARPGRGKTTLALNKVGRLLRDDAPVGIISLEMSAIELLKKMVCMKCGMDFKKFQDNLHTREEQAKFDEAMKVMSKWPLVIDDRAFMTVELIKSTARQWKRKQGINLLVIDYLQLIVGNKKAGSREEAVSEISRNIKLLAKELKIPIVLLAQLNRESEKENRAPRLTDLRESGSIEQDADIVTFLYVKNEDKDAAGFTNILRWNRPKQRNGPPDCSGTFKFNGRVGIISDF